MYNLFLGSGGIVEYAVIMVLMAGIAILGIFAGKALRHRKDLKKQNSTEE